jgi:hypothetical protein
MAKTLRRVSEWLAASLEMMCPVRGCGFESRALRLGTLHQLATCRFLRKFRSSRSAGAAYFDALPRPAALGSAPPVPAMVSPPWPARSRRPSSAGVPQGNRRRVAQPGDCIVNREFLGQAPPQVEQHLEPRSRMQQRDIVGTDLSRLPLYCHMTPAISESHCAGPVSSTRPVVSEGKCSVATIYGERSRGFSSFHAIESSSRYDLRGTTFCSSALPRHSSAEPSPITPAHQPASMTAPSDADNHPQAASKTAPAFRSAV